MLLSVLVPVFNEAENIPAVTKEIVKHISEYNFELIFINDGSSDNSVDVLHELHLSDERIKYINFSRNFGHQNALKAGLDHAKGDCVVSLDGDMQHPPSLLPEMINKWKEGYDIVYTKREPDPSLSILKRKTSSWFYSVINKLSEIKLEEGTADFRLMDKRVVDVFKNIDDNNLFIRGLVSWVGFKTFCIDYFPQKRLAGESKYNFKKMFTFALNGITSFSIKPLRVSIYIGAITAFLAFIYGGYAMYKSLFTTEVVMGWTSTIVSVLFIGGMQLCVLGILGEYIGKMFMQSKNRPFYIISSSKL